MDVFCRQLQGYYIKRHSRKSKVKAIRSNFNTDRDGLYFQTYDRKHNNRPSKTQAIYKISSIDIHGLSVHPERWQKTEDKIADYYRPRQSNIHFTLWITSEMVFSK
ncbi:hypothetical protein CDAR_69931 [Caerostris darwini]|uniref:Uncharacterized protein n=1 Tax=Caerostris darwini TaxID=1538125 RepID=A0AAV4T772_9ARAC|nr:hypothetical protein CDAR_69931 [Caerostris darwini]